MSAYFLRHLALKDFSVSRGGAFDGADLFSILMALFSPHSQLPLCHPGRINGNKSALGKKSTIEVA